MYKLLGSGIDMYRLFNSGVKETDSKVSIRHGGEHTSDSLGYALNHKA